jgi:hypothetical protein
MLSREIFCRITVAAWGIAACSAAGDSAIGAPGEGEGSSTAETPEVAPSPTSAGDETNSSAGSTAAGDTTWMSTSTGGDTAGTAAGEMCGDALVDPGEECDLGGDNRDDGPCTLDCEAAFCGDGKVWAGTEICDEGADNGLDYGDCSPTCERQPFCGDSHVDVYYEQCDEGPGNGGEGNGDDVACTSGCRWDARVVFVTSILVTGDLGGLATADAICKARAEAGGLGRPQSYMAWLSDASSGPLDRFVAIPAMKYVLPTGELVAESLTDLVIEGPGDGIRTDEFGVPVAPSYVWTGTDNAGEPDAESDHCGGWGSAAEDLTALAGLSHLPHEPEGPWMEWQEQKAWTTYQVRTCDKTARLYCVEQ